MRALAGSVTRCAALGSLALFASCTADDRGLSFELGTSMGSSTAGGATGGGGRAGATGTSGKNGATPNEGAGENAGGADASAGAGADEGGAGASSSAGKSGGGSSGGSASGGSANGGSNSGAGTSNAGTGGSGGSGGTLSGNSGSGSGGTGGEPPFDGPCGDLNRNLVDDCAETLVQNSRFETAAVGWEPEGSLQQAWVATNAKPGVSSGSLSLRNTTFIAGSPVTAAMGSRQCLVAWGGDTYEFAAKMFIASGQGSGAAAIDLVFFGNDGCDGTVLGGKRAASVEAVDAWSTARGDVQIPAGTRSVWVRLTVGKPLAQASFGALFDDVLVTKK